MLKKLRIRFICITMAIVTGMLLIIFGMVYHFTRLDLEKNSDAMLKILTQTVQSPDKPVPDVQLPYIIIDISSRGNVVASGNTHHDITDSAVIRELVDAVNRCDEQEGYLEQYGLRFSLHHTPNGVRIAFLDISGNAQALASMLEANILIGLASLAAFAFISILLARWAVKPVAKAWQQQKQFVSDASHELKTPLTVIISNAELLQSTQDAQEQQQFSENILSSSRQMRHLVEDMLDLARAENGNIQTCMQSTDLSGIISESVLNYEAVLFERGMILEANIAPGITVTGSQQHLRQLIDILLDNVQKYSVAGYVDVSLQRIGRNQCRLSVSNPGIPIPQEELQLIFERFYRSDTARSQNGSFGLGLSIAQRIVQEHNGTIWAESNPTGNCFHVLLHCANE